MSQFIAGQTVTLSIDNEMIKLKIEDASKSDTISAKVEDSRSPNYKAGQVYEFDRELFTKSST